MITFPTQYRAFHYGERLVDRVEFEELALKGLDPSLGPAISRIGKSGEKVAQDLVALSCFNEAAFSLTHATTDTPCQS